MLQNSYDRIAAEWHKNFRGQAYVDRTLSYVDRVLEGLPPQAEVLDLGCGTGNPIARTSTSRGMPARGPAAGLLSVVATQLGDAHTMFDRARTNALSPTYIPSSNHLPD